MARQRHDEIVVPDALRRTGARQKQQAESTESGLELLELMRERIGLADYSKSSILDIGCATRIPTTLSNLDIPVRRYVGMDVSKEVVEFLERNISDERFDFHYLDFHNEMYNLSGTPLTLEQSLPTQGTFDVICLFSVFTHMNPQDADCMLSVLRRYIDEDGKLIFTCFLDDAVQSFDDRDAEKPLLLATYTESFLRHLIQRNGWLTVALYPPTKAKKDYWLMQHCFVCEPTADM